VISSPLPDACFTHFQAMYNTLIINWILSSIKQTRPTRFDSNLRKENLKITKYGEVESKLNGSSYIEQLKEVPAPGFSRAIKSKL
jgi:hypothetical protein